MIRDSESPQARFLDVVDLCRREHAKVFQFAVIWLVAANIHDLLLLPLFFFFFFSDGDQNRLGGGGDT